MENIHSSTAARTSSCSDCALPGYTVARFDRRVPTAKSGRVGFAHPTVGARVIEADARFVRQVRAARRARAIVEEAGRHSGRLTGGAPRRAPAADGDAVAVEDQRAVGAALVMSILSAACRGGGFQARIGPCVPWKPPDIDPLRHPTVVFRVDRTTPDDPARSRVIPRRTGYQHVWSASTEGAQPLGVEPRSGQARARVWPRRPARRRVCRDRGPARPCGLGASCGVQTGGVRRPAAPWPAAASRCRKPRTHPAHAISGLSGSRRARRRASASALGAYQ